MIIDAEGAELARVEADDDPGARTAAMRHAKVCAAVRRDKGFAVRRLYTSELSVPVGELHGLPRISPAPAERPVITVSTGFTRKSIPTRPRESGAPGAMGTPGEAAKRVPGRLTAPSGRGAAHAAPLPA